MQFDSYELGDHGARRIRVHVGGAIRRRGRWVS